MCVFKSRLLPQLQYFQNYDNAVNIYRSKMCLLTHRKRQRGLRDYIIFCLLHVDVELRQGNAKSTTCINQLLL